MGYPYSVRREHYRHDPWYVMDKKGKGSIYTKGTKELTSFKGQRFEVEVAVTTTIRLATFLVDEKFVGDNIRAARDFPDVFPEELLGMPPDMEVELVIELLPGLPLFLNDHIGCP
jgi:hypothetical protein